ncbi:MAG TPA: hypothetical protein VFT98_12995 [Myxococcota bacterium]|nr:hypothetical protein [Myxococcota bacterium]
MQAPAFARAALAALALSLTACGGQLTIASWMNVDPGGELSIRVFGQDVVGPLEGGVFTIIRLDLTNPLYITGTIEVPQVRLASPGLACIRKDTASTVNGTIAINTVSGEQDVDFPLAVIANGPLFPGDIHGVGSPPPGSIQFPLDATLLEPILARGSLEGEIELPIQIDQSFTVGTRQVPARVSITLRSASRPPVVSVDAAAECSASWALQGTELDYAMNSRGTYLHTVLDNRQPPQIVDLVSLGVAPGDRLQLRRKASWSDDLLLVRTRVAGVFSSTSTLRETPIGGPFWNFSWSRLPDAINAGSDVTTPRTFWLLNPTNIREDFEIGDATVVTVPAGAKYLFLTPIDNHFDENFSFDLRVGVDRAP